MFDWHKHKFKKYRYNAVSVRQEIDICHRSERMHEFYGWISFHSSDFKI